MKYFILCRISFVQYPPEEIVLLSKYDARPLQQEVEINLNVGKLYSYEGKSLIYENFQITIN